MVAIHKCLIVLALVLFTACQMQADQAQLSLENTASTDAQKVSPPTFRSSPPVPAQHPDRDSIPLASAANDSEQWELFFGALMVRNVTQPALYPVLPDSELANGKAVIVLPGGGYRFVSMENEGFPVAEALAAQGYVAFVLKYRTVPSPEAPADFLEETSAVFRMLGKSRLADHPPAVVDLATAYNYLEANCVQFGCDNEDIHAIGFSAGARTLIRWIETASKVDTLRSAALIYPPMLDAIEGDQRPPLFVAMAANDPLFRQAPFHLVEEWFDETNSIEFHLYAHGDHGFGMSRQNVTASSWIHQYTNWLALYVDQD